MKKLLSTIFICFILSSTLIAQDTIRTHDLPSAGATYVLSIGTAFSGMNPASTGSNHNWNFSNLGRSSQRIDTMFLTSSTNPLLSFFFIDNALNLNRANLASRGDNVNLGFTGLSDIFNYYYNSASNFRQPGFGAVVNSVPIPIAYSPHDILYKFPLTYNDEDIFSYEYSIDLTTSIGIYYHVDRSRHNKVDGWGTLTTPYGTFDVIRIKSTLIQQDSTFVVPLNSGAITPPITSFEYKWMGKGYGLPLLQINTTGTNTVTQILYQDSIRLTGIPYLFSIIEEPVIFPNPASENVFIKYSLHENAEVKISLLSLDGKQVCMLLDESQTTGENIKAFDLLKYNLSHGNYLIKIQAGKSIVTRNLQIGK